MFLIDEITKDQEFSDETFADCASLVFLHVMAIILPIPYDFFRSVAISAQTEGHTLLKKGVL